MRCRSNPKSQTTAAANDEKWGLMGSRSFPPLRNFRASVETLCISSEAMAIIMLSGEGERTRNSATDPDKRLRGNFGHFSVEEEEFPFVQAGSKGKGRYCQKGSPTFISLSVRGRKSNKSNGL